jgi:hypothetical protein
MSSKVTAWVGSQGYVYINKIEGLLNFFLTFEEFY